MWDRGKRKLGRNEKVTFEQVTLRKTNLVKQRALLHKKDYEYIESLEKCGDVFTKWWRSYVEAQKLPQTRFI